MKKPRILLADDHPVVMEALQGLLAELGEVVGMVADGLALVQEAQRLEPDIILTDISMPKMNGLDAVRELQTWVPQCKVIVLTVHREPVYVSLALRAGACGYLLKRVSLYAELPQAVMHVLAGDRYLGLGVEEEQVPVEASEVPPRRSDR